MTARTNFSSALRRTYLRTGLLMQVSYCRRVPGFAGESAILHSFTSVVTRPNKFGLYLDAPYYCYGGQHRYRKLSLRITAGLLILAARWEILNAGRNVRKIVDRMRRRIIGAYITTKIVISARLSPPDHLEDIFKL